MTDQGKQAGEPIIRSVLQEREARLQSILETAPDAIIVIDDRGVIESYSSAAQRLFGFTAEEAVGQNVKFLMPAPYRERHDSYLQRYLTTGERRVIAGPEHVSCWGRFAVHWRPPPHRARS